MTRSPGVASKIRTAARRVSLESPTFDPRPKYATTGSTEPMPFVASRPLSGGAVPQPHPPRPASGRSAAQASAPGSAPSPRESSPAPYPQPVPIQPPTARTDARLKLQPLSLPLPHNPQRLQCNHFPHTLPPPEQGKDPGGSAGPGASLPAAPHGKQIVKDR